MEITKTEYKDISVTISMTLEDYYKLRFGIKKFEPVKSESGYDLLLLDPDEGNSFKEMAEVIERLLDAFRENEQ